MASPPPPPNRLAFGRPNARGDRMHATLLLGGCAVASIISRGLLPSPPQSHSSRRNLLARYHIKPLTAAPNPSRETALFWHIPKSGGTTLKSLYKCMNQTLAVRVGAEPRFGHHEDTEVVVFEPGRTGANYVNVDTISRPGILRAKEIGLVPSGMADLIVTSNLNFAVEHLYDKANKGRILALFRHPVDRLISKFFYSQVAIWERSYHPEWANMDILHWAEHVNSENNILTKTLADRDVNDVVGEKDLRRARMTLQTRVIVGLMTEMEESVHRFNYFLGIDESIERNARCMNEYFGHGAKKTNANLHPKVEEGSPAWNVLAEKNALDIRLYEDILHLFAAQRELIRSGWNRLD